MAAEMAERVIAVARDVSPELAAEIEKVRAEIPDRMSQSVRMNARRLMGLAVLKDRNPGLYAIRVEELRLQLDLRDLGERWRAATAAKDEANAAALAAQIETKARAQVDVVTLPDGSTRSRRMGAPIRTVEINWMDGVDTRGDDPDYYTVGAGVTSRVLDRSTPWQIEGLVVQLDGSHRPCVYLPRFAALDGSGSGSLAYGVLPRRHEHLYGRLSDSVRLESVQGTEGVDEVYRVATVTITEVV
jgi:hypothetical protein